MSTHVPPTIVYHAEAGMYVCGGAWMIADLDGLLESYLQKNEDSIGSECVISGKEITGLDTAGALAILQLRDHAQSLGAVVTLHAFSKAQTALLSLVEKNQHTVVYDDAISHRVHRGWLYSLGQEAAHKVQQFDEFVILLGELVCKIWDLFYGRQKLRIASIISNIQSAGIYALPIVGLLSLLIGVVLAYQMGLQLRTYGANIFIAYLSGMAVFREFGPLITAIIVAGRTSSAFTAQIGMMMINEEIDALRTMGLSPVALLVVPKVLALLLVFPLLIFWANVFGIIGAMMMSQWMLGINGDDFLLRLKDSVGLKQMMLGLYKAPTFALIIALVGCFQGFRVEGNANSVGFHTTRSVVQALFLIIVADAVYSIIYSWMDL